MKIQLMVTATGEDRPGIVARLTEVVVKHSGNLEASRMTILGGEFAAISLVTVPEEKAQALEHALSELKNDELTIFCKKTKQFSRDRYAGYSFYDIALTGADHEGIVHKISAHLRDLNVNFQSVHTEIVHAPVSGSPLFTMHASVAVPPSISFAELKKDLAKLADEEAVEIDLTAGSVNEAAAVRV
jgi:glycine cleavage system transcriptional repressor